MTPEMTKLNLGYGQTLLAKALALMLLAMLVVAFCAYAFLIPKAAETFAEEIKKRGDGVVKILEQHQEVRLALSLKDKAGATAVAEQIVRGDTDCQYVVFLDSEGRPLGSSFAPGVNPDILQIIERHQKKGESDEIQRFTQEVSRDTKGGDTGGGLDFAAGGSDSAKKESLGKILMGVSARAARAQLSKQTQITIGLTGLLLVVFFVLFFFWMARRLTRMVQFASQVAGGNLTVTLTDNSADEIGMLARALTEMTENTRRTVARMQEAATSLAKSSAEIFSSSSQQGQAATKQASSVAETGATVTELRETFNQAAERAQLVIDFARKSEESTNSGKLAVQESVAAMEQIRDQVIAISKTIVGLVDRTNQIGTIIDAVKDLAEQSNVLALNAAIEAANAGEHGRGFAVVAREVRNLAERSKDSMTQVRAILQDIEKASRDALGVIEEGTRKTQAGMELANRAGNSIMLLDQAINESSTAAKQIATSTRQQAVGVDQIWQAMREIDRAVNESASGIQQLEQASKAMKELSDEMTVLVAKYQANRVSA